MTTPADIPLKCRCDKVGGIARHASGATGNRLVCYCDDCQTFARFLEQPGVMDEHGGTEIFQMAPARLQITRGTELLRCVRLSPKGLYRFYAECCRTPVANMAGPRLPFAGVVHSFIPEDPRGLPREEALGKVVGRVQGRFAVGGVPKGADASASAGVLVRCFGIMIGWWIRGLGSPSPFFDPETSSLRVECRVLTLEERDRWRPQAQQATA